MFRKHLQPSWSLKQNLYYQIEVRCLLQSCMQVNCFSNVNTTKRREPRSFCKDKFFRIVANTHLPTLFIEEENEASLLHLYRPRVGFSHRIISWLSRCGCFMLADILGLPQMTCAALQSSIICVARSTTYILVSCFCCHSFKFLLDLDHFLKSI